LPNQPVALQLTTMGGTLPELAIDSVAAYPRQVGAAANRWEATYWPQRDGWHGAKTSVGKPFYWYVYGNEDWRRQRERNRYTATLQHLAGQFATANQSQPGTVSRTEPVPPLWFYLLFLLSAGYLWLERKL